MVVRDQFANDKNSKLASIFLQMVPPAIIVLHQAVMALREFVQAALGTAATFMVTVEFLKLATPIALSDFLPELYLASADFHALSMTRSGTPGLATGRITVAEFGSNGSVRDSVIRRAWNMGHIMSFSQNLGRRVGYLAMSAIGGPPQYNEPLDMDRPIIELLESTRKSSKFLYEGYGYMDLWVRIIEQSAPGYLDLEAQGRELEFKLDNLRNVGL
ncbi:hypothetical protein N7494_007354 [Penicillium frequentans]|uniref:Uncharacterized protein n=1 Tax=Penicillium frequentans TaxID=3151616 RepID=A0AAD6CSD9_9EURO|nr:hypothetical protein N7494_007354 [Penicillium glabrum]